MTPPKLSLVHEHFLTGATRLERTQRIRSLIRPIRIKYLAFKYNMELKIVLTRFQLVVEMEKLLSGILEPLKSKFLHCPFNLLGRRYEIESKIKTILLK